MKRGFVIGFPEGGSCWQLICRSNDLERLMDKAEAWTRALGGRGHVSFVSMPLNRAGIEAFLKTLARPVYGVPFRPDFGPGVEVEYLGDVSPGSVEGTKTLQ